MATKYYLYQGTDVLELSGRINKGDENSLAELVTNVEKIKKTSPITRLIIHQSDPELRIDSEGLGKLIGLYSTLTEERDPPVDVRFAGITGKLDTLLKTSKMETVIKRYETLDKAVASYSIPNNANSSETASR